MNKIGLMLFMVATGAASMAQTDSSRTSAVTDPKTTEVATIVVPVKEEVLRYNLNESGSHFFKANFLVQTWLRNSDLNTGSTVNQENSDNVWDIGIRRARMVLDGQVTDRAYIYFQMGMNNFSADYNNNNSRKNGQFFIHDAVGDYRISKGNQLKLGGGLTIINGLSRFAQPSVTTIMTLDVPVFLQGTTDQTDIFSRKLSVYAKGQIGKIDYRVMVSDPFNVTSNGNTLTSAKPAVDAQFSPVGKNMQYQGYVMYQFFEHEQNNTPYMTGTYLGKKKVFNIASGFVYQRNATWYRTGATGADSAAFNDMLLLSLESFLDVPLNKEKGTAISAFAGGYYTDYGKNYLRYNNAMNPATGGANSLTPTGVSGAQYGNTFPMFGTGKVFYGQFGYLLPKGLIGEKNGQLMPYAAIQHGSYDRLGDQSMDVFDIGLNLLMKGQKAKVSVDYQNRPTYEQKAGGDVKAGPRKGALIMQLQLFI